MTSISVTAVEISQARLHAVEMFEGLSSDEILAFLSAAEDLSFKAGEAVFQAGDTSRALYFLLNGSVEVDLEVPKLGERVVANLEVGSVFGELSFFHPAPHAATAKCVTDARIVRLTRSSFDTLAQTSPHLALRVTANAAQILAGRLQHTDQWIVETLADQREHEIRGKWRDMRLSFMSSFRQSPIISAGANLS